MNDGLRHEVGLDVVVSHREHGVVSQQGLQRLRRIQLQLTLPGDLGPHQGIFGTQDLHLGRGEEIHFKCVHHTPLGVKGYLWHPGSPPGESRENPLEVCTSYPFGGEMVSLAPGSPPGEGEKLAVYIIPSGVSSSQIST